MRSRNAGRACTLTLVAGLCASSLWICHRAPTIRAAPAAARIELEDGGGAQAQRWSAPALLGDCALGAAPRIAFPSDSPSEPTGPGAIVWALGRDGCLGVAGPSAPARWGVAVAALDPADRPMKPSTIALGQPPTGGLAAVGASFGRIALAASLRPQGPGLGGSTELAEGRATQVLGPTRPLLGSAAPPALARGYLGDAAIATVVPGPAIAVRVQRYFHSKFAPPRLLPIAPGRVTALTATMDYRSDVLLAWQQNGAIYIHMLRASGRTDPTQRVGASEPYPQLQALVSDDNHGILAWSSTAIAGSSPARTRVYLELTAVGVRVRAPKLVASFTDPRQAGRSPGSLQLVRLSTENVVLAWTTAEHGHYVVREAPAVYAASRPAVRLSDAAGQSVLGALASGPAGEAIALWQQLPASARAGASESRTALWAARTVIAGHDRLEAGPPEMIATASADAFPTVAVDPGDDRAVVAWLTSGAPRRLLYAVSLANGATGRRAAAAKSPVAAAGTRWPEIALATVGAFAALTLLALATSRRRRVRRW